MDYCMDNQQKAMELTTAALQKNPDIVGIFGVNVFSAQGAAQAAKNAGLAGAVKIASWDATQTLIDALKAGDIDLVLAQLPGEIGSLGVDAGYKYLSQKTAPQKKIIPGFQFFTKDNVNNPDMQQYVYRSSGLSSRGRRQRDAGPSFSLCAFDCERCNRGCTIRPRKR